MIDIKPGETIQELVSELAAQNDVLSFPTVVVYVEGQVAIRESGYFSLDEIFGKLERLIELMS